MITMTAMVMVLMAGVIRMLPGLAMMPVMFVHAAMRSMHVRFACCGRRVRRRMVRVIPMRTHTPIKYPPGV
ncbi:Uncharacterised protein [Mycolicibacterium phlei]|nr:hypothetical protein BKG56_13020 [Mycobacteroides chelonae]ORV13693.1 hypothetical protein AWB96_14695 [Mycobacteroides chelonae]VEG16260.1 Uncharacterised protein [Mycolicibacterium phlei]